MDMQPSAYEGVANEVTRNGRNGRLGARIKGCLKKPDNTGVRALKMCCTMEIPTADACAKLYGISLDLPVSVRREALEHLRCRQFHACCRRLSLPQATRPPASRHTAHHVSWLRANMSSTSDRILFKREHPLVLSRTLFRSAREVSSSVSLLLLQWTAFWSSSNISMSFSSSSERGFSIVTCKAVNAGVVLAHGFIDSDIEEAGYEVTGGGGMYGPAALCNAACKRCSNAIFKRLNAKEWQLVTKRRIKAGLEVTVSYSVGLACSCGVLTSNC